MGRLRLEGHCPKPATKQNIRKIIIKVFSALANHDFILRLFEDNSINLLPQEDAKGSFAGNELEASSFFFTLEELSSVLDLSNLPEHSPISKEMVMSSLYRHQLQSLQWCINRETPSLPKNRGDPPVQFWERQLDNNYQNIATNTVSRIEPTLCSGGILADDMGLGKTITLLSLIVLNKNISGSDKFDKSTLISNNLSLINSYSIVRNRKLDFAD